MTPNHVVIRERPWQKIEPLKRGAVEVESYGLHLRERRPGTYRLTLSTPGTPTLVTRDVDAAGLTLAFLELMQTIAPYEKGSARPIVWVHDLALSAPALLRLYRSAMLAAPEVTIEADHAGATYSYSAMREVDGKITIETVERRLKVEPVGRVKIHALIGSTWAIRVQFPDLRTVYVQDTYNYFPGSMTDQAIAGVVRWQAGHDASLASLRTLHPAIGARQLGERIADAWALHDVSPSPTPASTGAKIFRRSYLTRPLAPTPRAVESAAELAFHGGKIGCWIPTPAEVPAVYVYDVRSAYPHAMTMIPAFYAGRWELIHGCSIAQLRGAHGFVCVTGEAKECRWPCIPDHVGRWVAGPLEKVWITTYEAVEAIGADELDLRRLTGWVWVEDDHGEESPWRRFALDMFDLRKHSTDALQNIYKAAANGLYGKMIQRSAIPPVMPEGVYVPFGVPIVTRDDDFNELDLPTYWRAATTYYPVVASLVTGLVRVRMHQAEHAGEAVHSAVDAVHTLKPLPDEWLGTHLGAWREIARGSGHYFRPNVWQVQARGGFVRAAASGIPGDAVAATNDLIGAMTA